MGAGRPNKPTELHKLEGTYRADRHGVTGVKADLLDSPPKPPKTLSKLGKMEWNTVVFWMWERGILAATDLTLIAIYCNEVATYFECQQVIRKEGYTIEYLNLNGDKKVMIRPEVARQKEAAKLAIQYAGQFGYTPSARMKLNFGEVKIASKLAELKNYKPKGPVVEI